MSAEPVHVEDPDDPEVILRDLPERERSQLLRSTTRPWMPPMIRPTIGS
jgi:hypothetical protein